LILIPLASLTKSEILTAQKCGQLQKLPHSLIACSFSQHRVPAAKKSLGLAANEAEGRGGHPRKERIY
jgi:hypothetical protein